MTKTFKIALFTIIVLVLAAAGYIIYSRVFLKVRMPAIGGAFPWSNDAASPAGQPSEQEYASPDGYYFYYPSGLKVGQFEEGDGDVTLLQSESSGQGLQVYSQDFTDPGPLTIERIKKDEPDLQITEAQTATLDGDSAVTFLTKDGNYNIWLLRGGKIFEITAFVKDKDFVDKILNSWKWQDQYDQ